MSEQYDKEYNILHVGTLGVSQPTLEVKDITIDNVYNNAYDQNKDRMSASTLGGMDSLLWGKQDALTLGRGLKFAQANSLVVDSEVVPPIDVFADEQWLEKRFEDTIGRLAERIKKSDPYINSRKYIYKDVNEKVKGSGQSERPTVSQVRGMLSEKHDQLKIDGNDISTVVDTFPKEDAEADTLATSDGIARALSEKGSKQDPVVIDRQVAFGKYLNAVFSGTVYEFVDSSLNSDNVRLGPEQDEETTSLLSFGGTPLIGLDGKIPPESVDGLVKLMSDVETIEQKIVRNRELTTITPVGQPYTVSVEIGSCITLEMNGQCSKVILDVQKSTDIDAAVIVRASVNGKIVSDRSMTPAPGTFYVVVPSNKTVCPPKMDFEFTAGSEYVMTFFGMHSELVIDKTGPISSVEQDW